MIKKTVFLIVALLILATGCSRKQVIPDDTLAEIFRDAYLTNAYLGIKHMPLDSIEIYEPMLKHYGYTPADFRYTIGNFSRRKSAQLGSVLRKAEEQLSALASEYEKKVTVLDTIRNVAIRSLSRTVAQDSLIEIKKLADTAKLKYVVENLMPGSYSVRYSYKYTKEEPRRNKKGKLLSPTDQLTLRGAVYVETNSGSTKNNYSYNLRERESIRRTIPTDTASSKIVIVFAKPADARHKIRKPDITVSDIVVSYTPDETMAIDSLFKKYVDIKIFDDVFFTDKADSLASAAN